MNFPKIDHAALVHILFSGKPSQRQILLDIEEKIRELQRDRDELIAERVESDHYKYSEFADLYSDEDKWRYLDNWIKDYASPLSCATWFDWYQRRNDEEQALPE